jgi:hypothetical protein
MVEPPVRFFMIRPRWAVSRKVMESQKISSKVFFKKSY